jgi:hypothetical protein
MLELIILMLRPLPKTASHLALDEFSERSHATFSADSPEWHQSHEPQGSEPSAEKTEAWHATS